jgi:hypothetical protein
MSNFENDPTMVEVGGFFRPQVSTWASKLPTDGRRLTNMLVGIAREVGELFPFVEAADRYAKYVEPYDRVLGADPKRIKTESFKAGIRLGTLLVAPMYAHRPKVITHARAYMNNDFALEVRGLDSIDQFEAAHIRGDWIVNKGGEGRRYFEEIDPKLDELIDEVEPRITNQLYTKAGAGVGMLAVWEGYREAETHAIEQMAGRLLTDPSFDTQLQDFLSGN